MTPTAAIAGDSRASDRVCIHIGLPKTATTMLQKHLFRQHSQIAYGASLAKFGTFDPDQAMTRLIADVCYAVGWNADLHAAFADTARAQFASQDRRLVISNESISFNGSNDRGIEATGLVDRLDRVARLKQLFPDARIIYVVRRPQDWLRAIYLQRLKGYGSKHTSYASFGDWVAQHWRERQSVASIVGNLRYGELARAYADAFGRANVCVLPFERLVEDSEGFLRELAGTIDIDADEAVRLADGRRENETLTRRQLMAAHIRAQSGFGRYLLDAPGLHDLRKALAKVVPGRSAARPTLSQQMTDMIADYCADDLRALAADWGLPLARYGYPV